MSRHVEIEFDVRVPRALIWCAEKLANLAGWIAAKSVQIRRL